MSGTPPFVILQKHCDQAVSWAVENLEKTGFRTVRTFDLQAARMAHLDCPCPHHGTAQCNCQMVVLLVYQGKYSPATLVIHGSDTTSYLYLLNLPSQPAGHHIETSLRTIFDRAL